MWHCSCCIRAGRCHASLPVRTALHAGVLYAQRVMPCGVQCRLVQGRAWCRAGSAVPSLAGRLDTRTPNTQTYTLPALMRSGCGARGRARRRGWFYGSAAAQAGDAQGVPQPQGAVQAIHHHDAVGSHRMLLPTCSIRSLVLDTPIERVKACLERSCCGRVSACATRRAGL
jgi:hypothetical protein